MPEQARRRAHRVAAGDGAMPGRPLGELAAGSGPRQAEEFRRAGGGDVGGAPGQEVGAEVHRHQGRGGRRDRRRDGLDGAALRGRTGEAAVPVAEGGRRERRMGVRQVGLGLDAFVADPVGVTTPRAQRAAGQRGARERHGRQVDRAVEFLEQGARGGRGPLHAAGRRRAGHERRTPDEAHEVRRGEGVVVEVGVQEGDQLLAFAAGAAGDLAGGGVEVRAVRQVEVERVDVRQFGVGAVGPRRRGQPAEEQARVVRIADAPVARLGTVDAAGGPDARPITLLVRDGARLAGVGIRAGNRHRSRRRARQHLRRIHVRPHGHALVGAGELLELGHRDAGRGEGVETRPEIAGVTERQAAFHLQERGEDDHHHHHRRHDGQREYEGETRAFKSHR